MKKINWFFVALFCFIGLQSQAYAKCGGIKGGENCYWNGCCECLQTCQNTYKTCVLATLCKSCLKKAGCDSQYKACFKECITIGADGKGKAVWYGYPDLNNCNIKVDIPSVNPDD